MKKQKKHSTLKKGDRVLLRGLRAGYNSKGGLELREDCPYKKPKFVMAWKSGFTIGWRQRNEYGGL